MIGYKIGIYNKIWNCSINKFRANLCMIELEIPDDAIIVKPYGSNKLRCDKAKVVSIRSIVNVISNDQIAEDDKVRYMELEELSHAKNLVGDNSFEYNVGEMVYPDYLDKDKSKVCTHGIHFFKTWNETLDFLISDVS